MKTFIFKGIMITFFTYSLISCSVDVPNQDGTGTHEEYATDDGYLPTPPPPPPPPPLKSGIVKSKP
ncbi:hypothetical protein [Flavobacterium sp. AG291]|uniref:hypothetical protein n=1 Tax=Flavobacterium sp. AG291 TaxID=2184000 RepID=UPI0011C079A9|nr:hypothetical protein [Flavobacterium sp. AG291]